MLLLLKITEANVCSSSASCQLFAVYFCMKTSFFFFFLKREPFAVYKKHYPPALKDEVWRLEKIGKDGSFHKRLNKAGIFTVEEFLQLVVRDTQRLRNVRHLTFIHQRFYVVNCVIFPFLLLYLCIFRSLGVECQTRCGRASWSMQRLVS